MNETFHNNIDNSVGDLNGERVFQPETQIARVAHQSLSENTDARQKAAGQPLSGRRGDKHHNWNQGMSKVEQAIAGLASGCYSSMSEAGRALGYQEQWLSNLKQRRPDIAERLQEACSTPEFKAAHVASRAQDLLRVKAAVTASGQDKDALRHRRHAARIEAAVNGLKSGLYGSMSKASTALGLNENWLNQARKRNPAVAEMIEGACASPAFKAAARRNAENYKSLRRRRPKNLETVNQAITGIASGEYEDMRQASLSLGFNSRWLYERQRVDPEIAERLREIDAKAGNCQSTARQEPVGNKPQKPAARQAAAAQDPESDASSAISNFNSILRWSSGVEQMSATKKALQIINFWEGDVTLEEVMTELQKLGVNTKQQSLRKQVTSLLERKSRYFQAKG